MPATPGTGAGSAVDVDVSAALAALTLTENPAAVALDVSIAAGVHALTLTGFAASLESVIEVPAGVASLTLTENAAAIAHDINVTTALEALTLTEFQAGVLTGADIPAVIYNGFSDYLKHTGGPAGASDGTTGTVVWSGKFNSDGSAMSLARLVNGTGTVLSLRRTATNTVEFKGFQSDASTAVFSNVSSAVLASLGYMIILASFTGTSAVLKIVSASGTITGVNTPGSAGSIEWTSDLYLGQDGASGELLDANTSLWWLDDAYINFAA